MQRILFFVPGLLVGLIAGFFLFGQSDPEPVVMDGLESGMADRSGAPGPAKSDMADQGADDSRVTPTVREAAPPAAMGYDPALGTLVYGTVTSSDGRVIDNCRLSFASVGDSKVRRSAVVEGGTGFATMGLTPGRWTVYSKPENFAAMRQEIEILDQPTQRLDFELDPSFLVTIKLQDSNGRPLNEAVAEAKLGYHIEIVTVAAKTPFVGDLPMTDLRGHSRYGIGSWRAARGIRSHKQKPLPKDVAGTLEVSQPPPLYVAAVFRHVVLATAQVNAGDQVVVLKVPIDKLRSSLSTIRLQVTNAVTGQPVEGARVSISDRQSSGGGQPTDVEGRITFEHERVGLLELEIWAKGLERYYQLVRLPPGDHDLGTIGMYPTREVELMVFDAAGAPATGVAVQWQNLDRRSFLSRRATTDPRGRMLRAG